MAQHFATEIGPFHTGLLGVVIGNLQRTEQGPTVCERQGDMIDTDPPPCGVRFLPLPYGLILGHLQSEIFVDIEVCTNVAFFAALFCELSSAS